MEGYLKTQLSDHQGNILFPETSADVVRESPNRRFVSYVEAKVLGEFAGNPDVAKMLVENGTSIRALVDNEPRLSVLLDQVPSNFDDITYTVEELGFLLQYKQDLLDLVGAPVKLVSKDSGLVYLMVVDDSDLGNPVVKLERDYSAGSGQPASYTKGQTWTVEADAPDVHISIPIERAVFENLSDTILPFGEGLAKTPVPENILQDLVNGKEDIVVSAKEGKIPQIISFYNIKKFLEDNLPGEANELKISSFISRSMAKHIDKQSFAQTYMNGNIVQPVRTVSNTGGYTDIVFQDITWTNSLSEEFLNGWMNGEGIVAEVLFGQANGSISLTRPSLEISMKNPYIGMTITAQKDMEESFNILDWKISE